MEERKNYGTSFPSITDKSREAVRLDHDSLQDRRSAVSAFKTPITPVNNSKVLSRGAEPLSHLIPGALAGIVPTCILHPFEFLKIVLAAGTPVTSTREYTRSSVPVSSSGGAAVLHSSNDAATANRISRPTTTENAFMYRNFMSTVRAVYNEAGVAGFYAGVTPNVIANALAWGSYLALCNTSKSQLAQAQQIPVEQLSSQSLFVLAIGSGLTTLALTNPLWVVKTRLCLQYGEQAKRRKTGNAIPSDGSTRTIYRGTIDCLAKTWRNEGIRGWYKGFLPGTIGTTHGAIQFTCYDKTQWLYKRWLGMPLDAQLKAHEYVVISSAAKMFAITSTYPYQVLRVRLQDHNRQSMSVWNIISTTAKLEGVRGFYRGLVPSLLRTTPATAMSFVIYEKLKFKMQQQQQR